MTDSQYTHIELVIDESESMQANRDATEDGINAFLAEQAAAAGRATITLSAFNHATRVAYEHRALADAPPFVLSPQGNTALLDAVGSTLLRSGHWLASLAEDRRPGQVMVVIVTDGMENASREFTRAQIRAMIERQQDVYSWDFSYMGANQDAVGVGGRLGIARKDVLTFATRNTRQAFGSASSLMRLKRDAAARGQDPKLVGYSEGDRERAVSGI